MEEKQNKIFSKKSIEMLNGEKNQFFRLFYIDSVFILY
jgi:hypothetical protein